MTDDDDLSLLDAARTIWNARRRTIIVGTSDIHIITDPFGELPDVMWERGVPATMAVTPAMMRLPFTVAELEGDDE